ncbi:hypothetical protein EZS27_014584 [termite gut metagenome]|uniref:Uncharacterized protein n=1 Tax=termite gut metagenome TaxID=433724 RepID=A0A5J4RTJ5_9ZZZZ
MNTIMEWLKGKLITNQCSTQQIVDHAKLHDIPTVSYECIYMCI